ncbi:hypothetical protein VFPBJ_04481 [Purpureocillium lilacinum]|uniref:Uncharacterized protein n=1 Tax=Purpureocillium lilacinum TaxID=33203 RepID=A0A179GVB7_PURLI|nr:hypothetical protein VFPBJ_04481 [Purpureocillium lilacinum]
MPAPQVQSGGSNGRSCQHPRCREPVRIGGGHVSLSQPPLPPPVGFVAAKVPPPSGGHYFWCGRPAVRMSGKSEHDQRHFNAVTWQSAPPSIDARTARTHTYSLLPNPQQIQAACLDATKAYDL